MYRFKASKYKNASPTIPKKEGCITEFSVETPVTFGDFVAASAKLVAFCCGSADSGKLMVFDINTSGRLGSRPALNAHSDGITAIQFSPFNHCRLATASMDRSVKVWDLPPEGITAEFSKSETLKLSGFPSRPECIAFHPLAENVLAVGAKQDLLVYSVEDGCLLKKLQISCDLIQSISWKLDGTQIAATTKDCQLLICDPRAESVVSRATAHANHKESRVLWLGESDKLITTGFSKNRVKELKLWDAGQKLECVQTIDQGSGTGVLMPFYDEDTGMLFLAAKGDSSVTFFEFSVEKEPNIQLANQKLLQTQTKGMAMLPKLAVNASSCEVVRLFQLSQKMLVPISWTVPRKSLRDFPFDLFPDTASDDPAMNAQQWLDGAVRKRSKISLDPTKLKPLRTGSTGTGKAAKSDDSLRTVEPPPEPETHIGTTSSSNPAKLEPQAAQEESVPSEPVQPKFKPFTGVRASKFRHWAAKVGHPSSHVTNIEPLSLTVLPSSDASRCNQLFGAVPLKGPGGRIAVVDLSKPGRMTEHNSLTLHNSSLVTDLQWNPFNPSELAVALENSLVKVWNIPGNGHGKQLEVPSLTYKGHVSKPVVLCFHPLADHVIASAEVAAKILIWNVKSGETMIHLSGEEAELLSMSWSLDGRFLATSARDTKLRIYDPRKSSEPVQRGSGPTGTRSSRLSWTCKDKFLAVSGFNKFSSRCVTLYSTFDLADKPLTSVEYDVSPSVLSMHYDVDSSTLFLLGKADHTISSLEVNESEHPHLFPLSSFKSEVPIQSCCFLPKCLVNPAEVEFARAWGLVNTTYQPLSFRIPRVKMEFFQDDLFPATSVTWEKTMTAEDWSRGLDKAPRKLDLRPKGMKLLSEAPREEPKSKKFESYDASTYKTDAEKKEELLSAMSGKLDLDKELEQDTMEGVDEDEWDDY